MRICLYTHTAHPLVGGQEGVVDALARQFLNAGHNPVVVAPRLGGRFNHGDSAKPYRVVRHPRFISTRRGFGFYQWWLKRIHQRYGFHVIHCHGIYPCGYVAIRRGRPIDVPIIVTSHGADVGSARRLADPELHRRHIETVRAADALVSISGHTRKGFLQHDPSAGLKIVDILNGVDTDAFCSSAPRPEGLDSAIVPGSYMLFLGRLVARKGVDVLLKALALTPANGLVQLVVAGDGLERESLQALAKSLGLSDRVRFVGMASGQFKTYLLQNARCVVAPTVTWEGLPLVVLEAFAAGRPVIASDLPSMTDLVRPEKTGWLAPPGSPERLAACLQRALLDVATLESMGEAARMVARTCSWEAIAEKHLALYAQLVDNRRTALAA